MRGAARAFVWEFGRHHWLSLLALATYIVSFWAIKLLVLGPGHPIKLNPPNGLAGFIIAPVTFTFFYFVAAFSYGLEGDLAGRESMYPRRLFTLPVSTAGLAGWPMLYGTTACVTLWIATTLMARWPGSIDYYLPWVWPGLLIAAYLAWTQALMWMPYGVRGLRVIIAAFWLTVVDIAVLVALNFRARELYMIALLAPQIPLAYLVARHAVARARRGDVPDWRVSFGSTPSYVVSAFRRTFSSPSGAQTWFEWRRHGRALPAMVAIVLPFELALLFIPGNNTAPVVFLTLGAVALTPRFMALFAAPALSTPTRYDAARPLTTADLIAAKLKMTILSTLAAWAVAAAMVPAALALSGTMPVVVDRVHAGIEVTGALRGGVAASLLLASFVVSTWKSLVQSLCIGLTGRDWFVKSAVLLALAFFVAIWPMLDWVAYDTRTQSAVWNALPWILVGLVACKMMAAAWIAVRLYDSRLLGDRTLIVGAGCWLVTVLAVYAVLGWLAASPLFPSYFVGAIAIVQVPLARVSAAPLALAWSRHQ